MRFPSCIVPVVLLNAVAMAGPFSRPTDAPAMQSWDGDHSWGPSGTWATHSIATLSTGGDWHHGQDDWDHQHQERDPLNRFRNGAQNTMPIAATAVRTLASAAFTTGEWASITAAASLRVTTSPDWHSAATVQSLH
jgi:hypothetical protein